MKTAPQRVPNAPWIVWWLERTPQGVVWIHFACERCRDASMKQCENFRERGAKWIATYAGLHVH